MLRAGPIEGDIERVLITPERIHGRVVELADQIFHDYRKSAQPPVVVCIMKGAKPFSVKLASAIGPRIQLEEDFMLITSYHGGTQSSGVVKIVTDLHTNIAGRDVIIVEDIVDTGHTMDALLTMLRTRNPKSMRVCTLLKKCVDRDVVVPIHYWGFEIPNEFVVGFGLDYKEGYRHLPFIGVLKREVYCRS